MKYEFNKELIEGLRDSTNIEFVENITDIIENLLSTAVGELAVKTPFIQIDKIQLLPVNEIFLKALCANSEYTYFLGIPNKEIELNSLEKKHYFKNLWKRFVRAWKVSRKTKRRKKKDKTEEETPTQSVSKKYTIDELKRDLVNEISKLMTQTSLIYNYDNHISIVGREDLGANVKVNVYVCMLENDTFKIYDEKKNKFHEINFTQRFKNLGNKYRVCGESFVEMVRIYNSLYSKVYNKIPNQILIESLLCACPNKLFTDDLYQTFINVSNFIRLNDVTAIRSVCTNTKSIFKEKLITNTNGQVDFSRLIKLLDLYKV